jgi:transposase InsO family protein
VTQKVISMQTKLAAVLAREAAGAKISVSEVCRNLEISRETYYKYRRRFAVEGLDGLVPRSRRPHRSPGRVVAAFDDEIRRARKELAEEGWDDGAISIHSRLLSEGLLNVPSVRTIHRILIRLGLVTAQPRKRPRASFRRFEFPATDDCWQIDAFEFVLADDTKAVVFELLDDHSRYELETLAWPAEDGAGAWACVSAAIERYGQPRMLLSDNGTAFSRARLGRRVAFETNLRLIGVQPITSRPYHPETCGKNERLHQTARKWLAARPRAQSLAELQTQLDTYRHAYNHDRPHQGIGNLTPAQRRITGTRPDRPGLPLRPTTTTGRVKVNPRGEIVTSAKVIALGSEYCGLTLTVFNTNGHIIVFNQDTLIREFDLDPTRKYQPSQRPRGGPRRTRISDTVT